MRSIFFLWKRLGLVQFSVLFSLQRCSNSIFRNLSTHCHFSLFELRLEKCIGHATSAIVDCRSWYVTLTFVLETLKVPFPQIYSQFIKTNLASLKYDFCSNVIIKGHQIYQPYFLPQNEMSSNPVPTLHPPHSITFFHYLFSKNSHWLYLLFLCSFGCSIFVTFLTCTLFNRASLYTTIVIVIGTKEKLKHKKEIVNISF